MQLKVPLKFSALIMLFGGALVMTAYAVLALLLVHQDPSSVFWLGIAAHVQIGIIFTALAAILVKRRLAINTGGVEVQDQ